MTVDASVKIRVFEIEDYDQVYRLWMEVFPENTDTSYDRDRIRFFLERNPGTSFVAVLEDRIVGAVLAGHDGRRGYIHHLGILQPYRQLGIGKRLIQSAEEALVKLGLGKVHLFVFKDNMPAKGFYKRIGYAWRGDLDVFSKNVHI